MFRVIYLHYGLIFTSCFYPVRQQHDIRCFLESVIDGDTVYVSSGGNRFKLRLLYIDALEKGQIKGKDVAKTFLSKFRGKRFTCRLIQRGYYGRWLGEIYSEERSLNFELIKRGFAYLYPYSKFETETQKLKYLYYFKQSQTQKKGIFKSIKIIKPWVFRRRNRLKKNSHPKVRR